MSTDGKNPTLEGVVPETSHARAIMILIGFLVAGVVVAAAYRAATVQYKERQARDSLARGADFLAQGYFEDAKFELETAERLGPESRKTYLLLAKTKAALGDVQAAVSDYRRVVELDPTDPESHFFLALALSARGRRQEAIEEAETALGLKADYAAARLLAARLLEQENRLKEAADQYQELAKFSISRKQLAAIHVALAKLYIKEKRQPLAKGLLQSARAMDRKNEEARRLLISLNRGAGHQDDLRISRPTTDSISSKITGPARAEKINDDVVRVTGGATAKTGAVVQVEVTYDGGRTWHRARPINGIFDRWVANVPFPKSDRVRYVLHSLAIGSDGVAGKPRAGVPIFVDNTGPFAVRQLTPPAPGEDGWYLTPPTLNMAVLEGNALLFYKWGNGEYLLYTSELKAPAGIHTLSYFTRDSAGNESPVERLTVKVKVAEGVG